MSSRESEKLDWALLKRLYRFIKPYRLRLIAGIGFGILYGATSFGLLAALGWATGIISGEDLSNLSTPGNIPGIDLSSEQSLSLTQVIRAVAVLPIVAIVQGMVFFASKYYVEWVGNRAIMDLRHKMFTHIHALPMYFFSQSRSGDLITRITSDTGMLTNLVANVIADAVRSPFALIGSLAFMFYSNWRLSIMALVVFPVCIAPIALISRRIRRAARGGQEGLSDLLSSTQESIGGAIVVKAFQMEDEEEARFTVSNMKIFKMIMKQTRAVSLSEPLMTGVSALGLAGIVIYSYINELSLAVIVTFGAAMINMYKPAKKLSQLHMQISRAMPSTERIFEILDIENTICDTPDAVEFTGEVQTVEFRKVDFSYGETAVLSDINLTTNAGQCFAFVGSSGAGKTTLVNLIPRFYEVTGGAILLNGKDLRSYTLHSLRKQIGIVTQETILFNRSVAENISYGSSKASREDIAPN